MKITGVKMDMLTNLDGAEIFKGLTREQYQTILTKGDRLTLQKNSILYSQDDPARKCFLVHQGRVKLTKLNEQGKEVIIGYLKPGEVIAATAVLRGGNYLVSAECIGQTKVVCWDKPTILTLMREFPDIAINLLGIILERMDEVQHRYLELCTETVDQRIARTLLRFMRKSGVKRPDGIHIDIPLSRQNIADYSGTTLSTVSRTLSNWEKMAWIKSGREKISITDPHSLVLFAEGIQ